MATAYYFCPECQVQISVSGRNRKDADRRVEWLQQTKRVCADCENKAATEAGRKYAAENNLPALTGTPKQIAWAEALRKTLLERLGDILAHVAISLHHREPLSGEIHAAAQEHFSSITSASAWIDMNLYTEKTVREWLRPHVTEQAIPAGVRSETIVRPERATSDSIVVLEVLPSHISIQSVKDDTLIALFKKHGCRWEHIARKWQTLHDGHPATVAANLADAILKAGFTVQILNCMKALEILQAENHERKAYLVKSPRDTGAVVRKIAFIWAEGDSDVANWLQDHFPGIRIFEKHATWVSSPTSLGEFRALEEDMGFFLTDGLREHIAQAHEAYNASVIHKAPRRKAAPPAPRAKFDVAPELLDN